MNILHRSTRGSRLTPGYKARYTYLYIHIHIYIYIYKNACRQILYLSQIFEFLFVVPCPRDKQTRAGCGFVLNLKLKHVTRTDKRIPWMLIGYRCSLHAHATFHPYTCRLFAFIRQYTRNRLNSTCMHDNHPTSRCLTAIHELHSALAVDCAASLSWLSWVIRTIDAFDEVILARKLGTTPRVASVAATRTLLGMESTYPEE